MTVTRIAEKAGVSIATVSRVLNNSRPVDPAIVERVHKAAEQLGMTGSALLRRRGRIADRQVLSPTTIAVVTLGQRYREWFEKPAGGDCERGLVALSRNRGGPGDAGGGDDGGDAGPGGN